LKKNVFFRRDVKSCHDIEDTFIKGKWAAGIVAVPDTT
jgi:hypothetical protein